MSLKLFDRLIRIFDSFFDFQVQTYTLNFFRKSICTYYFVYLFSVFPNWNTYYGASYVSVGTVSAVFDIFRLFSFFPFQIFWVIAFFIAIWHWTGKSSRLSSIVLFVFHSALMFRNPFASSGEDYVLRMLLFYSCFFPWTGKHKFFGSWSMRLAQMNLVLVYILCCFKQITVDPAWLSGEAMFYLLINPAYNQFLPISFTTAAWASGLATYLFLFSQIMFPVLIWFSKTRNLAFCGLIIFHLTFGIILSHFGFFSLIMLVGLTLFYQLKVKIQNTKKMENFA